MPRTIQSIKLFCNEFARKGHGILVVTPQHEIVCYSEKFKDVWKLSKNVLQSQNEIAGLKEAAKNVNHPQFFFEYVMDSYATNKFYKNTVQLKNDLLVVAQPYFIKQNENRLIAWTVGELSSIKKNKTEILDSLTTREKQILYYYLFGFTAKAIAKKLFISARTVEVHVENIKHKLNCYHRDDFIHLAKLLGLIKIEFDVVLFPDITFL